MSFDLVVRGTGYFGGAAGTGGDKFEASEQGGRDLSVQILYFDVRQKAGLLQRILDKLDGERSDIKTAYVSQATLSAISEIGVLHHPTQHRVQMENMAMGNYALYRFR